MNTENENWRNATSYDDSNAAQEGNQFNGNYGRSSYNRESSGRHYRPRFNPNAEQGQRSYRPRFNSNGDGDERSQRVYNSERPYRPRYNAEGGEYRSQRSYGERSQRAYSSERPYRPRYNAEGGEQYSQRSYRSQRQTYDNNTYADRPQRSRYNTEEGEQYTQRTYGGRPQRSRFNDNRSAKPYGNNRPQQRQRTADYNPNAKYSKKKQIQYKEQFVDPNEPIRLNKFLANAGVCSRREADEFITAGVVSVNGVVVTELGTKIKRGDEVKFHDQPINIERKIYVLLNKPKDTVTTSDDPQARRTVLDLVKDACAERIYPVGRLDRNTTGVLLLTNDGDLASKLTHPKYLKKKIYHVHLDKNLTKADMEQIATGIQLEDGEIHADAISYTDEAKKNDVGIEIHSGKNRIVRRIFETLGYKVQKLDRVYFAGLTKKGLRRGDWRFLTEQEVNFLRMGSFE